MQNCLLRNENYRKNDWKTWVFNIFFFLLVMMFACFIIFNITVSVCSVDGNSMLNTLKDHETVLLEKKPSHIKRGDIVTIGGMSDKLIIKRVMALEGDKLVFKENDSTGRVDLYRDIGQGFELLQESSYIKSPMTIFGWQDSHRIFKEEYKLAPKGTQMADFDSYAITVGEGECFVLGDNRNDSSDSRKYGAGKLEQIQGRMFYSVPKDSVLEKILLFIYREKGESKSLWSK